ncbi:MAG: cardiolipin synthase [Cryomorphaceae bacterium]|jgi:cardiolipin synthase
MSFKLVLLFLTAAISACSYPETSMWNERDTAKSIRMPAETFAKVIVIGNLTTLVRNPISSNKKRLWMFKKRSEIVAGDVTVFTPVDENYRSDHSIEDLLDKMKLPKRVAGNVDYLIDGEAFFGALHDSVNQAKKSICTRVFIFDNDDLAVAYANHLKKRSKDVRCRVIMDELGSLSSWWVAPESKMPAEFKPPISMPRYLKRNSKVSVRLSKNPGLVTDHTKLFIFDEKEAYLGGMNIGREYRVEWHDMMVRIKGPVVRILQNEFNKAWRIQGRTGDWTYPLRLSKHYRNTINNNELGIRILKTSPGKVQIEKAIIGAIRMAKHRIYIQNSYFTSNSLEEEIIAARKRGVDVQLVFPLDNDSKLLAKSNEHFVHSLLKSGAKVYAYPKFTHVKALIVDDWVCVGSANFDALSMRINEEINIAFTDKKKADELVNGLFRKDIKKSTRLYEMKISKIKKAWLKPIVDQL